MRILLLSPFFPPLSSIASLRTYSFAKYWTLAGEDVSILTTEKRKDDSHLLTLPNPGFSIIEIPENRFISYLRKEGVGKAKRSLLQSFREKTGILSSCRMPDVTDLWIAPALKAARKRGIIWDVALSSSGPYSTHLVAEKLKEEALVKKWVLDFRDLWIDNHNYPGLFPFTFFERYLEKRILQKADLITTVSAPLAATLAKKVAQKKIQVIENGFDPVDAELLPKEGFFPQDDTIHLAYTGTIYRGRQNLTPLFEALPKVKKKIKLWIAGTLKFDLEKEIARYQVERWVQFLGPLERQKALSMQRDADALLFIGNGDLPHAEGILTGKLFEYLFSKTPILAIGTNPSHAPGALILEAKAGMVVDNSPLNIERALSSLTKKGWQQNPISSTVLDRFTREYQASKLLHELYHLHDKSSLET